MKKLAIAGVAAAALTWGATAQAADIYTPAPEAVYAPVSVFSWTGFYAGLHVGYGWGDIDSDVSGSMDADGFLLGGQIGANYQFMNGVVVGLEGDLSWTNIEGDTSIGDLSIDHEVEWLGTVRARLGYAFDRFLPYVTGGVAFADAERSNNVGDSDDNTHFGYVLGAGVEYAFADNLSAKLEYQYLNFDEENYALGFGPGGVDADFDLHTVRVGLNYRF